MSDCKHPRNNSRGECIACLTERIQQLKAENATLVIQAASRNECISDLEAELEDIRKLYVAQSFEFGRIERERNALLKEKP